MICVSGCARSFQTTGLIDAHSQSHSCIILLFYLSSLPSTFANLNLLRSNTVGLRCRLFELLLVLTPSFLNQNFSFLLVDVPSKQTSILRWENEKKMLKYEINWIGNTCFKPFSLVWYLWSARQSKRKGGIIFLNTVFNVVIWCNYVYFR